MKTMHVSRVLLTAALLVAIAPSAFGQPASSQRESSRRQVVRLALKIQRADYEGDRATLQHLYEELAPFANNKQLGLKVRYWRGFAMWRRVLNGFNDSIDRDELEEDLKKAISEFDAALAADPGFVDAKVAAAACLLNLVFIHQNDVAQLRGLLARALPLMNQAEIAEPDNPRLLWVLGSSRWYNPPERGGGQELAIQTYEKGLRVARQRKRGNTDPLNPSWGEPELLMNLAWSNLNRSTPDCDAAERYARSALALVPYWHYVRDILLSQIAAARRR